SRGLAIATDRLASSRSVRNPIASQEDLEGAFNAITYQKGSAVLEMFEAWIGRNEFRAGVRDYMQRHAWGSATSTDFFRAIAGASGKGPEAMKAFEAFVDQAGVPLIDLELACGKGAPAMQVSQQRLRPKGSTAKEREWTTPACFRYNSPIPGPVGEGRLQCEPITNAERTIALTSSPACPGWILGNANGSGHYVVRYGPFAWKRLVRFANTLPALEATALVNDTGLLAQSGLVPMAAALELADAALSHKSPAVQLVAVRFLDKLPDARLDASDLRKKRAI